MRHTNHSYALTISAFGLALFVSICVHCTAQEVIPDTAPMIPLPVRLLPPMDGHQVTVIYADASSKCFLFPTFAIKSVYYLDANRSVPIAGADQPVNVPSSTPNGLTLTVNVLDFEHLTEYKAAVEDAFKKAHPLTSGTTSLSVPSMSDTWQVSLTVPNRKGNSAPVILQTKTLERAFGRYVHPVEFKLTSSQVDMLRTARIGELTLKITSTFSATFTAPTFKVTVTTAGSALREQFNRLTSNPDNSKPALIFALGGDIQGSTDFSSQLNQALEVSVLERAGLKDSHNGAWARELVKQMLLNLMNQAQQEVTLRNQDQNTVVSFILGNTIKITAPIAELTHIVKGMKTNKENKFQELVENKTHDKNDIKVGLKGSISLPGGIGGSNDVNFANQTEKDEYKKHLLDTYNKYEDELQQVIDGKSIPSIVGLNVSQFQKFVSNDNFSRNIDFATFTNGRKDFILPLSFTTIVDAKLDSSPYVPLGTIIDWYPIKADMPLPYGFEICDGNPVQDPDSPYTGSTKPNMTDRFTMGVTEARGRSHEAGGTNIRDLQHTHQFAGVTGPVATGRPDSYVRAGIVPGNTLLATAAHVHDTVLPVGNTTVGSFSAGTDPSHFDVRPQYLGVLKLIRVK